MPDTAIITIEVMDEETARKVLSERHTSDKSLMTVGNLKMNTLGMIAEAINGHHKQPERGILVV